MNYLKFLYILTSNCDDLYYEQALLSITSLKMKMPKSYITLLTDDKTSESLNNNPNRKEILSLINEYKEIKFSQEVNNKYRSRWLKTSMRQHIKGDFLFLDCDTVIAAKLKPNVKKKCDLAAVLDIHQPIKKRFKNKQYKDFHIQRDKLCGFTTADKYYYNSGILFCKDSEICHDFFSLWHKLWLSCVDKGILEDQPSFNMANILSCNVISRLDGTWNCQLVRSGLPYLANAKIIHYFNAADNKKKFFFAKKSTYELIKETGAIPSFINKLLNYPRSAFVNKNNNFNILFIFLLSPPINLITYFYVKIKTLFI